MNDLSRPASQQLLQELEAEHVQARGEAEKAWHRMGTTLVAIRDSEAYRVAGTTNFMEYAKKRFGYGDSHIRRLLDANQLLPAIPSPGVWSEAAMRELAPLKKVLKVPGKNQHRVDKETEQIVEQIAPAIEAEAGGKVTAKLVEKHVELALTEMRSKQADSDFPPIGGNLENDDIDDDAEPTALDHLQMATFTWCACNEWLPWNLWQAFRAIEKESRPDNLRGELVDAIRAIRDALAAMNIARSTMRKANGKDELCLPDFCGDDILHEEMPEWQPPAAP